MFGFHSLLLLIVAIGSIFPASLAQAGGEPYMIENRKTELFIERTGLQPGAAVVLSPYIPGGPRNQTWIFTARGRVDNKIVYAVQGSLGNDYFFVNGAEGNGLTMRPIPTLFHRTPLEKPFAFMLTLPLTSLALAAPDKINGQATLQNYNSSDIAQQWFFINV